MKPESVGSVVAPVAPPGGRAKTVLMVDYVFPPLAGAGAQRTLGYIRHLAPLGWRPIVLTVRSGESVFHDPSLLARIPQWVDVQRTASLEPVKFAKRLLTWASAENNWGEKGLRSRAGLLRSLRRMGGLERWFLFPDRHIGWFPFAVARALSLSRRRAIDIIYSSSTVITSHAIAYVLKKILAKPWVADFQDPWAEDDAEGLFASSLHRSIARRFENLVLRNADRVTVTTNEHREMFERRDERTPPDKVLVIPMGFDPGAFHGIRALPRLKFTITHLGSFYETRSPAPFLEALGKCVREHPRLSTDLEVLLVGSFDPALRTLAAELIDRYGLHDVVRLEGPVPHGVGLQMLVSSDVLLLITHPGSSGRMLVPSKLYEYLAAGRPILALMPDGAAAGIVRAANVGFVVPPGDVRAIGGAIWDFYRRREDGRLAFPVNCDVIEGYAWRKLTTRLASVFDSVLPTQ